MHRPQSSRTAADRARTGGSRERGPRTVSTAVLLFLLLSVPDVAAAQRPTTGGRSVPSRLSLQDALEMAHENNPAYLATRNDLELADWDVRTAYGQLLPSASASGGLSWQGGGEQLLGGFTQEQLGVGRQPSYYFSRYSVGLSYQLSGSTLLEPSRTRAARDATEAQIAATIVALDAQVTRAYLEVLRRQEEVVLAEQQLERARFDLRMASGRSEVGQATALDVMQAELQVGRAEVALLQARGAVETARLRLLQQMGVDARADREMALTTAFEMREPGWEREELYRTALRQNPTLRSRRSTAEASETGVEIARSAYYPTLSLSAGISGFTRQAGDTDPLIAQARSQIAGLAANCEAQNEIFRRLADPLPLQDCTRFTFTDDMRRSIVARNDAFPLDFTRQPPSASLTVSLPLFQGFSRHRQLQAARLQRDDARQQEREQELALAADVAIGLSAVRTAYRSAVLERRNQTYANEQLRLAQERYRLGAITFVDLVEAETVKAQADRQRLDAEYAYHLAVTDLEAVVGAPLRGS